MWALLNIFKMSLDLVLAFEGKNHKGKWKTKLSWKNKICLEEMLKGHMLCNTKENTRYCKVFYSHLKNWTCFFVRHTEQLRTKNSLLLILQNEVLDIVSKFSERVCLCFQSHALLNKINTVANSCADHPLFHLVWFKTSLVIFLKLIEFPLKYAFEQFDETGPLSRI